jgi:ABC-type glycerol-3-phosphate transport system permease component
MQPKMTISRAVIYAALILFALYFLFPLYVMLSTSFKDIDQRRRIRLSRRGSRRGVRRVRVCVATAWSRSS